MTDSEQTQEDNLVTHLVELRNRLMKCLAIVALIFVGLIGFSGDLYHLIATPLLKHLPDGTSMIATEVASPFLAPFKLTIFVSIFIAMPFLLYQLWAFVAPGLYQHEKRYTFPILFSSIVLFYCGTLFAYFVVFPLIFAFFTSVAPEGVAVMTDISHYLSFVIKLFFAFGLAFEIPIATLILLMTGVIQREQLIHWRPYVIIFAFVVGMLLTPPDIFSQTFLAVPMWILFELGLFISKFMHIPSDIPEKE